MLLTDIANKIIIESGQFNVGAITDLDLSLDRFWVLTKGVLKEYNRFTQKRVRVDVHTTEHTFTAPFPLFISAVVPNVFPSITQPRPDPHPPIALAWEYDPSTGHLAMGKVTGGTEVIAHYEYPATITKDTTGVITQVDIPDLTETETHFFSLLTGKFLLAIGRSRRAFTLTEIPISSDSDSLVAEGTSLVDEARGFIEDQSDWAFGSQL